MQPNLALPRMIDDLLQEAYKPAEAGAAVIVTRAGQTLLRQGYGMASLELGVPVKPDMSFRVGSLTKQFTAVAILMLMQQGKLALDDPLTKILPDYPTHGYTITIEHLLTHTSGIRSYTDMPEWLPLRRKDFTLPELIDFFKHQPMQSAPGQRWAYNNSGYILLGAIIEKVSEQTYEQFIRENIFDRLGMRQSYYDDPLRIIPGRVSGYEKSPAGYTNAEYLSMTQPYAAGALASTVDDLALWDAALYTDQLLKPETLQRAFVSHRLSDGSSTSYGYGWIISEYESHRLIEHGGGINGFRAYAIRMPDEHAFAAILSNNGGASVEPLVFKIAAAVLGKPYQEPIPIVLSPEVLSGYAGIYQFGADDERHVTCADNKLFLQSAPENPRWELVPFARAQCFFKANPLQHATFMTDANGQVIALEIRARSGIPDLGRKLDKSAQPTW